MMQNQTNNDHGKRRNAMKDELISRNDLLRKIGSLRLTDEEADGILHCMEIVEEFPAVDAVPVVRCKDCKHRGNPDICPLTFECDDFYIVDRTGDDRFCDKGEMK